MLESTVGQPGQEAGVDDALRRTMAEQRTAYDRQSFSSLSFGSPQSGLALHLPADTSFDQWQNVGRELFARERTVSWWIGDWWAFGEHRYGERAKAAAQGIWGLSFGTLMNLGSIARSFETSRRREALPFSHHAEVAALPPAEADALLDVAVAEKQSVRDVRKAALNRKIELGIAKVPDAPEADQEYDDLVMISRAWNRACQSARQAFLELATEADLGVIEP